jgi:hypothetical protein
MSDLDRLRGEAEAEMRRKAPRYARDDFPGNGYRFASPAVLDCRSSPTFSSSHLTADMSRRLIHPRQLTEPWTARTTTRNDAKQVGSKVDLVYRAVRTRRAMAHTPLMLLTRPT